MSGEGAKKLAEAFIKVMEELVPQVKALYDLMADGRYTLIWFKKWAFINRMSKYIMGESKVSFANAMWSPSFENRGIELIIQTKDVGYAEELRERLEAQGISATITKVMRRDRNKVYYNVKIRWNVLKKFLYDPELRTQLIRSAIRAIENCRLRNMLNKGRKKECNSIPAVQWLRKLIDPQWLREYLGCPDLV